MLSVSEGRICNEPDVLTERTAPGASDALTVSIVIPVHNAAGHLERCLDALSHSTVRPLECIVVDDGSTDNSAAVAGARGAKVLQTEGRTGPARARNLAANEARGSLVFFLDADVCVQPDTIARVLEDFRAEPAIDAVIGSYDDAPGAPNYLSQYRNLMHAFVHQHANRVASTFWSGCGAIRRDVFLAAGGFDELYGRPTIEDIELGGRIVRAGRRIVLDRTVQAKHLKRWTFWNLLKTDVLDRGIPWTELILRDRRMPNDLNLKTQHRLSVVLVFAGLVSGAAAAGEHSARFLAPILALLFVMLSGYWAYDIARRHSRGAWRATVAFFMGVAGLAYFSGQWLLIPALAAAFGLIYLKSRAAYAGQRPTRATEAIYSIYGIAFVLYCIALLPSDPLVTAFLCCWLTVVLINHRFYAFMARRCGLLSAGAAIPLHLFHYFYSGMSLVIGTVKYAIGSVFGHRRPSPSTRPATS